MVKINEIRKWKTDTNNESFKVILYKSFFINEHYYIIEYSTDNRKQTVTENELLNASVLI